METIWKYFAYINATTKVLYDKTSDYIVHYTNQDSNNITNIADTDTDTMNDYDGIIKIELYENENKGNNTRIYPVSSLYDEYSTFYGGPTHIIDGLYLGSAFNAASYDTLKNLNIKVIINATSEISNYYPDDFIYLRYSLYDNNKTRIINYLENSFNDIQHHQKNTPGNILIHCFMGASRSASIIIYYLMKTQKNKDGTPMNFDDAFKFIRNMRCIVNPTFRLTKDLASSIMSENLN